MATRPLTRKAAPSAGIAMVAAPRLPVFTGITTKPNYQEPRGMMSWFFNGKGPNHFITFNPGSAYTVTTLATNELWPFLYCYCKPFNREKWRDTQQDAPLSNGWPTFGIVRYATPWENSSHNTAFLLTGSGSKFSHDECVNGFAQTTDLGVQSTDSVGKIFPGHLEYTQFYYLNANVAALTGSGDTKSVTITGDYAASFETNWPAVLFNKDQNTVGGLTGNTDLIAEKNATEPYEDAEMVQIISASYSSPDTTITYKQVRHGDGSHFSTLASGGGSSAFTTANNAVIMPLLVGQGSTKYLNFRFNFTDYCMPDNYGAGETFLARRLAYDELNCCNDAFGVALSPKPIYYANNYDVTDISPDYGGAKYNVTGLGNSFDDGFSGSPVHNQHAKGIMNYMSGMRDAARTFSFAYDGGSGTIPSVDDAISFNNAVTATAVITNITGTSTSGTITAIIDLYFVLRSDFPEDNDVATVTGWTGNINGAPTLSDLAIPQTGGGVHDYLYVKVDGTEYIEHGMETENVLPTSESKDGDAVSTENFLNYHMRALQVHDLSYGEGFCFSGTKSRTKLYPDGQGTTTNDVDWLKMVSMACAQTIYAHSSLDSNSECPYHDYSAVVTAPAGYTDTAGDSTHYDYGDGIPTTASFQARIDNRQFAGKFVDAIQQDGGSTTHHLDSGNLIHEVDFNVAGTDLQGMVKGGSATFTIAKATGNTWLDISDNVPEKAQWDGSLRTAEVLDSGGTHDGWDFAVELEMSSTIPSQCDCILGNSNGNARNLRIMLTPYRSRHLLFYRNILSTDRDSATERRFSMQIGRMDGAPADAKLYRIRIHGAASLKPLALFRETETLVYFMNGNDTSYTFNLNQDFITPQLHADAYPSGILATDVYNATNPLVLTSGSAFYLLRKSDQHRVAT